MTLCAPSLTDKLAVRGKTEKFIVRTVGGVSEEKESMVCRLKVSSLSGLTPLMLRHVRTVKHLPCQPSAMALRSDVSQWKHLCGLPLPEQKPESVEVVGSHG